MPVDPPLSARLAKLSDDPLREQERRSQQAPELTEQTILARSQIGVPAESKCAAPKLAECSLSGLLIQRISGFDTFVNLRVLDLSCNRIEKIEGMQALLNLRQLKLAANRLRSTVGIGGLHRLEVLHIQHNQLTQLEDFDSLRKLQILSCSHNHIRSIKGLMKCTALRTLEMSSNQVADIELLGHLKALETLDLSSQTNGIKKLPKSAFAGLVQLEELDLENNQLKSLPSMRPLSNLATLRVGHNLLETLGDLGCLPKLCELHMGYNQISTVGELSKWINIEVLDLSSNLIRSFPFEALTDLSMLTELSLEGNPVADQPGYVDSVSLHSLAIELLDGKVLDVEHSREEHNTKSRVGADKTSDVIPLVSTAASMRGAPMSSKAIDKQNVGMLDMLDSFKTQMDGVFYELRGELKDKFGDPSPSSKAHSRPSSRAERSAASPQPAVTSQKPSTPSKGSNRLVLDANLFARPSTAQSGAVASSSRPGTAQSNVSMESRPSTAQVAESGQPVSESDSLQRSSLELKLMARAPTPTADVLRSRPGTARGDGVSNKLPGLLQQTDGGKSVVDSTMCIEHQPSDEASRMESQIKATGSEIDTSTTIKKIDLDMYPTRAANLLGSRPGTPIEAAQLQPAPGAGGYSWRPPSARGSPRSRPTSKHCVGAAAEDTASAVSPITGSIVRPTTAEAKQRTGALQRRRILKA